MMREVERHSRSDEHQAQSDRSVLVIMGDPPSQSVKYLTPFFAKNRLINSREASSSSLLILSSPQLILILYPLVQGHLSPALLLFAGQMTVFIYIRYVILLKPVGKK